MPSASQVLHVPACQWGTPNVTGALSALRTQKWGEMHMLRKHRPGRQLRSGQRIGAGVQARLTQQCLPLKGHEKAE